MNKNHNDTAEKSAIQKRLFTVDDVATYLSVSRWSVYQLINSRRLRSIHINGRRLFLPEDLEEFIDSLRAGQGAAND